MEERKKRMAERKKQRKEDRRNAYYRQKEEEAQRIHEEQLKKGNPLMFACMQWNSERNYLFSQTTITARKEIVESAFAVCVKES